MLARQTSKIFSIPKEKSTSIIYAANFVTRVPIAFIKCMVIRKMELLMLTFKLAEELQSQGIKINALQISRVKISKETIQKMGSPFWKVLARAQNLD